jgi:hypothetical protein
MHEEHEMTSTSVVAKSRGRQVLLFAAGGILAVVALVLIAWPGRSGHTPSSSSRVFKPEVSTIDPAALVPQLADLPAGSSVQSDAYVTTGQASKRNQTSLAILRSTGREIGFERDFQIPSLGEIDIEVVRFKSHVGMGQAYAYFLRLPSAQGLDAVPFRGLGERAALVASSQAGFVEFMRGRYYAVITTVPATKTSLRYIHKVAQELDFRILHYQRSA